MKPTLRAARAYLNAPHNGATPEEVKYRQDLLGMRRRNRRPAQQGWHPSQGAPEPAPVIEADERHDVTLFEAYAATRDALHPLADEEQSTLAPVFRLTGDRP